MSDQAKLYQKLIQNSTRSECSRSIAPNKCFSILDTPTLADVSITERYDLQEFICNSPDRFFKEIGQELFLLGKEIEPSRNVQDRIDVLLIRNLPQAWDKI